MSFIHDWLSDTGIDFIAGRMFSYPLLISITFGFLTILAIIAVLFYAPKFLPPIYMISLMGATGCVFLGARMILQPDTFFVGYSKVWQYYLNTAKTGYVQERFGCCGYNRPREFANDNCTISITQPCLKKIIYEFSTSIQIGGVQIFLHGISFGLLLYFAIMAPCPSVLLLPPAADQGVLYVNQNNQPQNASQMYSVQQPQQTQQPPMNQMYMNTTPQTPQQTYMASTQRLPPSPIQTPQPVRPPPPSAVLSFTTSQQPQQIPQNMAPPSPVHLNQQPAMFANQQIMAQQEQSTQNTTI